MCDEQESEPRGISREEGLEDGGSRQGILRYLVRIRNGKNPEGPRIFKRKGFRKKRAANRKRRLVQLKLDTVRVVEESTTYGDGIFGTKEKGIVVYFQNVNGIWKERGEDLSDALGLLETAGAGYVGLTESLVNERNEKGYKLQKEVKKNIRGKVTVTSNPLFDRESGFQPGGIVTVVRNPLQRGGKERVDPTGNIRLTETKYKGKSLGIFTFYCPQKAEGPMRVHTQAVNAIRSKGLMQEPIDVTKFLYDELERMVERFRTRGGSVIIGGDFNEEDLPKSKMTKRMEEMGLENAIAREGQNTPETFKSGKKTIDHIWVSPEIKEEMIGSGYCNYDLIFNSDHRRCFIRLRAGGYADGN